MIHIQGLPKILFSSMVTHLHKWIVRYSASLNLKTMDQQKCYLRYMKDEEKVNIALLFKVNDNITRQFNFSRCPSEPLDILLARIGTNIKKVLSKCKKKKGSVNNISLNANFFDNKDEIIENSKSCIELFAIQGPVKLKILDNVYDAVFNPPWVLNVSLPQCILAGFPVYPENFEAQNTVDQLNIFKWYSGLSLNEKHNQIVESHIKWDLQKTGFTYTPSFSDIGKKLKLECCPANSNMFGPTVEVITTTLVEAGPGKCPFESRHAFTKEKLKYKSFRCVSYNILADLYCDSDFTRTVLHPYCPAYALKIDYRKQLILMELLGYNADLICLQEVDAKIFKSSLQPVLTLEGFDGVFFKKGKAVAEGLACFYRRNRFRKLYKDSIVLSEAIKNNKCFESIWISVKDNKNLLERLLDRSTVASVTILQSVDNPESITVVGNTHLYFHPDADHIRLIQGGMFIYWINEIAEKTKKLYPDKLISILLFGDYNSVPSCGIYQLYTTGIAPSSLDDWKSNANEIIENLTLKQDIPLGSACGTPEYTNFTAGFADCLDYIFFDKRYFKVEQVIPFPTKEELQAHTALPSIVFPSDHIALIADLTFQTNSR